MRNKIFLNNMSRVLLQCLLKNPETFLQEQKTLLYFHDSLDFQ